jgi:hypothetical protein
VLRSSGLVDDLSVGDGLVQCAQAQERLEGGVGVAAAVWRKTYSFRYGVGKINASNAGCVTARTVAAAVKNRSALSYTAHGFRCTGKATEAAPGAKKNWRCTRTRKVGKHKKPQTAVVTFFSIGV